jgi:hypothetical protein
LSYLQQKIGCNKLKIVIKLHLSPFEIARLIFALGF